MLWSVVRHTGNNETLDRSRVTLKDDSDNVKDAILIIENTVLADRNVYNCSATNAATGYKDYQAAEQGAYVRVKGNTMKPSNSIQHKFSPSNFFCNHFEFCRKIGSPLAIPWYLRRSIHLMCHYSSVREATQQG